MSFVVVYSFVTYHFATKMNRLMLLMGMYFVVALTVLMIVIIMMMIKNHTIMNMLKVICYR